MDRHQLDRGCATKIALKQKIAPIFCAQMTRKIAIFVQLTVGTQIVSLLL
jgi:hypothetical protein